MFNKLISSFKGFFKLMFYITGKKDGILLMILLNIFFTFIFYSFASLLEPYKVCILNIACIHLWRNIMIIFILFSPLFSFLIVLMQFDLPYEKINFKKSKKFILGDKKVIYFEI